MALTLANVCGFETGDLSEADATSGTPSVVSTPVRGQSYALSLPGASTPATFGISLGRVKGFGLRLSDVSPGTRYELVYNNNGGGSEWSLNIETNGDLTLEDANDSTISTISAPFAADTWYFVELYADGGNAAGAWEISIDGTSQDSGTGADFFTTAGRSDATVFSGPVSASDGTVYIDDIYGGAGVAADFLGAGFGVKGYTSELANATDNGSALNAGQWGDTGDVPWSASNEATYSTNNTNGSTDTDNGTRAGPSGDGDVTGATIVGAKWLFNAYRSNGSNSSPFLRYGDTGGTTDVTDGDPGFTLGTSASVFEFFSTTTNVPTTSDSFRLGMGKGAGGRNITISDAMGTLAFVASSGTADGVGSAAGTGAAAGVGSSTAASPGAAAGTGAASGVGISTAAAPGAAAGTGAAAGVGNAVYSSAGSAAGTGAAAGDGAAVYAADGAASGTGAASGVGISTAASPGAAAGTGAAVGVGASTAASDGSAAGTGAATGVGSSTAAADGAAAGVGGAEAVGEAAADAEGVGSASGTGAAQAVGQSTAASDGAATGSGAAAGVGAATAAAAGAAAGVGGAEAAGEAITDAEGVGNAAGVGAAAGIGASTAASDGAAAGTGAALGVGTAITQGVGIAAGTGAAAGVGDSTVADSLTGRVVRRRRARLWQQEKEAEDAIRAAVRTAEPQKFDSGLLGGSALAYQSQEIDFGAIRRDIETLAVQMVRATKVKLSARAIAAPRARISAPAIYQVHTLRGRAVPQARSKRRQDDDDLILSMLLR